MAEEGLPEEFLPMATGQTSWDPALTLKSQKPLVMELSELCAPPDPDLGLGVCTIHTAPPVRHKKLTNPGPTS